MKILYRNILLMFILVLPLSVMGQRHKFKGSKNYKYRISHRFLINEVLSIYGSLGLTNYYGDLCDNFSCMSPRPNIGVGAIYRFNEQFSSKSEINYLRLHSGDVWTDRNFSFRSGNVEMYTSVMYDYFKYTKNFRHRNTFSPYGFLGFGVVFYNPHGEYNGHWYALRPIKTEGIKYGTATPIIPFGVGVKYKYTRKWDFLAEIGYRITFSDHIDDVSALKFKKQSDFNGDVVAASLSNKTTQGDAFQGQRGNPKKNDGYFVLSVKARYTFTQKHYYRNKYSEQHRKIY